MLPACLARCGRARRRRAPRYRHPHASPSMPAPWRSHKMRTNHHHIPKSPPCLPHGDRPIPQTAISAQRGAQSGGLVTLLDGGSRGVRSRVAPRKRDHLSIALSQRFGGALGRAPGFAGEAPPETRPLALVPGCSAACRAATCGRRRRPLPHRPVCAPLRGTGRQAAGQCRGPRSGLSFAQVAPQSHPPPRHAQAATPSSRATRALPRPASPPRPRATRTSGALRRPCATGPWTQPPAAWASASAASACGSRTTVRPPPMHVWPRHRARATRCPGLLASGQACACAHLWSPDSPALTATPTPCPRRRL